MEIWAIWDLHDFPKFNLFTVKWHDPLDEAHGKETKICDTVAEFDNPLL